MEDFTNWITASINFSKVLARMNTSNSKQDTWTNEPQQLVEIVTGQILLAGTVVEVATNHIPAYVRDPTTKSVVDLLPIDQIFGTYSAESGVIEIHRESIKHYAKQIVASPEDLETTVRIHEYAHAVVHQGLDRMEQGEL